MTVPMPESPFEGRLVRLRARDPRRAPTAPVVQRPGRHRVPCAKYPVSHHMEKSFLDRAKDVGYHNANFAIVTRAESRMIGGCGFERVSAEDRHAELGIAIGDKAYWDGGYGTDTMRALCRFGFEIMNLHRIQLDVYAGNERAQHVYEKVGFRIEARKRQGIYKFGAYQDVLVMGLLEGELRLDD